MLSDRPQGAEAHNDQEKSMKALLAATLPLMLCLPGLAAAGVTNVCSDDILQGQYVFTASGFTRPPASAPGTAWVPKAILEVFHFNGDGTLSTPVLAVANPFGDSGNILQPPSGRQRCVFDQRRLQRHRAVFRRDQCDVQDPSRPTPRQHDLDDSDQPAQQRLPGERAARVLTEHQIPGGRGSLLRARSLGAT